MATKSNKDWQEMMEEWFMKLPPLPKGGKEVIVKITPWIALIFGILGIVVGLAGLGALTFLSPFVALSSGIGNASGSLISVALALVSSVLLLMAFPGTKEHKIKGWKMLFWSEAVSVLASVVALSLSGIIFEAIAFYLLFQIKSYYK